jgi:hypothetical protein
VKKSEKPRFYGQNKLLLEHLALQPLGSFNHMAACRSSSENVRKMKLIPVLNKTSPWAHMELELDVLGIPRKLVEYIVHLFERKNLKIYFSSHKLPKQQLTNFWSQGVLGFQYVMSNNLQIFFNFSTIIFF